jgi:hypothetical protein
LRDTGWRTFEALRERVLDRFEALRTHRTEGRGGTDAVVPSGILLISEVRSARGSMTDRIGALAEEQRAPIAQAIVKPSSSSASWEIQSSGT